MTSWCLVAMKRSMMEATLKRIEDAGITPNSEKCIFHQNQLKFLGHIIDKDGVHVNQEKVKSVVNMKASTNISEFCCFMGIVNQLAKFSANVAKLTQPLRELLSKKNTYLWSPNQEEDFEKIKQKLSNPTILALYDPTSDTKISADASTFGLGSVLLHKHGLDGDQLHMLLVK